MSMASGKDLHLQKGLTGPLIVLAICVAFFWGFSFLAMDVLLDTYDPIQVLSLRWVVAAMVYAVLVATGVIRFDFAGKPRKWLFLTALAQPCIYSVFETYGVMFTSSSMSSIFIATIPCMTLIEGILFFRHRTGRLGVTGILLAFAGVVVCTVFAPDFAAGGKLIGYLVFIVGIPIGAIYGHFSSRAGEHYSPLAVTAMMAFLAAPWFTALNFAMGYGTATYTLLFTSGRLVFWTLFLGLGCSVLCFLGYNVVLQRARDTAIATNVVSSLVTATGVTAGVLLRGDTAGWYTVVGVAMTITGVVISSRDDRS